MADILASAVHVEDHHTACKPRRATFRPPQFLLDRHAHELDLQRNGW